MTERMTDLRAAAERRAGELLPILERWVRTNSYSAEVENVNRMGELLVEDFAIGPLRVERIPGDHVGDHLVWRTPAWASAQSGRIVLIGHHDTVFPPGTFDAWELDGGRLRGPGVLDMKGGLATVRGALAALDDVGMLADLPLALISVGDEEIGSIHSRPHLEDLARGASAALVFEAGRTADRIITQRKGTGGIKVVATGVAAHAGNYHADGINAIWAVARFIDAVQRLTDYDAGVTVNVGLVSGGEARNTVPHSASCSLDLRFLTVEDGERTVAEIRRLGKAISEEQGAALVVEGGIRRPPLERSDASAALCREYGECAAAAGLGSEESPLLGGGSDANTVGAIGVPAIDGLGPRGLGFHTHDEYIEVSTLPQRTLALALFLAGRA